ncbi:MAG: ABC transporter permease, partial [Actinobacteria bacterium]|nr:ABC transporter permease [Actinomycetota bacterium]
ILPFETFPIFINRYLSDAPAQLYRVRLSWVANNGASVYPGGQTYVYYTRAHRFELRNGVARVVVPGRSNQPGVCERFNSSFLRFGEPFLLKSNIVLQCFSEQSPGADNVAADTHAFRGDRVGTTADAFFPLLVSAIDPVQEARLIGLDQAMVTGRYLRGDDGIHAGKRFNTARLIAGTKAFLGEELRVTIERLPAPGPRVLPFKLARKGYPYVKGRHGEVVATKRFSMQPLYDRFLGRRENPDADIPYLSYWETAPVAYRAAGAARLAANKIGSQESAFTTFYYGGGWVPQDNRDTQYRRLTRHEAVSTDSGLIPGLHVVGRFDPELLPGFNPLSRVPLETYYPPIAEPADEASREALGGEPLLPTRNLGGYIGQPPLMLTTLKALRSFADPNIFEGADPDRPISVIRVRVAGVEGPDPQSRARIRAVAERIHEQTGLSVDVTAGSSPTPMLIELPAGEFGQPPLLVREGWVAKGVAVRYLEAVNQKSLLLFVLVLVSCSLFLANAALASVRSRRAEIGTLLTLGWSPTNVFAAVLAELVLIGAATGVVGIAVAFTIAQVFSLELSLLQVLLVLPIAVVLALVSGFLPARVAASAKPLDAVVPITFTKGSRGSIKGYGAMALTNLLRVPARTLLGASGLIFGVASLTTLIALNQAFQKTLVGTLLGGAVSLEVRAVDLLSVLLVIALGALSVADVLYINLKQRQAEVATLRAVGWSHKDLARLVASEGLGIGILGSTLGVVFGVIAIASVRGIPLDSLFLAAGLAGPLGVAAALVASLVPALRISALAPHSALVEE